MTAQREVAILTSVWENEDSLIDVAPEHSLTGFGLKAALDNEPALSIQGAAGTQLSQQEELHMFWLPVHGLAQLHVVGEHSLLCAFTRHLHTKSTLLYKDHKELWTCVM